MYKLDFKKTEGTETKLPMPLDPRKHRGTRDKVANICWIIKKAREFQKNICFCFIDYAKAFDCVDQNKLWKIPQQGDPTSPS